VTLTFSAFGTEAGYDFVKVYGGSTTSAPVLGSFSGTTFSGSSLPAPVTSATGTMLVTFNADGSGEGIGFSADYSSIASLDKLRHALTPVCPGAGSPLTAVSGTISDGPGNYTANLRCSWLIQRSSAVTLTFSQFGTEFGHDAVKVYGGSTTSAPVLGSFSGTTFSGSSLPAPVTSATGTMLVTFVSDDSVQGIGFVASYSVTRRRSGRSSVVLVRPPVL
jgi:hypothetical protein